MEDLAAHLNSSYAYPDNIPKKGRGRANKREDVENEAYEKEKDNFRNKATKDLRMPLRQPDMFSGGGSTGLQNYLFHHFFLLVSRCNHSRLFLFIFLPLNKNVTTVDLPILFIKQVNPDQILLFELIK